MIEPHNPENLTKLALIYSFPQPSAQSNIRTRKHVLSLILLRARIIKDNYDLQITNINQVVYQGLQSI